MSEEVMENTPETLEKLINEVNEYKDKFYRATAETENMRKRVEKEKQNAIKFANEKFAFDLLETVDNFENLLTVEMPEEVRNGIELVYKTLKKTLEDNNIIECETETFDPEVHEAVSVVESEQESKTIVNVLRKGYTIDGRLLRPAMVVVAG